MDACFLSNEYFENECDRVKSKIISIIPRSNKIIDDTVSAVVREEYASGGECLHRGYYSPDRIVDVVVGGLLSRRR